MSAGLPWKLYLAPEGEPRQLIDAFATLREASRALADVVGVAGEKLPFRVTVYVGSQVSIAPTTRFFYEGKATPYVIDLVE